MFERYTDPAKRAIFFARDAVHRGMAAISPEDLLLGLLREATGRADRLANLRDNAAGLRAVVFIPHLPITSTPYRENRDLPLTKAGKRIVLRAASEANADREFQVDIDHVLRALLRENTPAAAALKRLGCSHESLKKLSRENRTKNPSGKATWFFKPPFFISISEWKTAGVILALIILFAAGLLRSLLRTL